MTIKDKYRITYSVLLSIYLLTYSIFNVIDIINNGKNTLTIIPIIISFAIFCIQSAIIILRNEKYLTKYFLFFNLCLTLILIVLEFNKDYTVSTCLLLSLIITNFLLLLIDFISIVKRKQINEDSFYMFDEIGFILILTTITTFSLFSLGWFTTPILSVFVVICLKLILNSTNNNLRYKYLFLNVLCIIMSFLISIDSLTNSIIFGSEFRPLYIFICIISLLSAISLIIGLNHKSYDKVEEERSELVKKLIKLDELRQNNEIDEKTYIKYKTALIFENLLSRNKKE
jgi:hypothetical protein